MSKDFLVQTENLDLPSLSAVSSRGPTEVPFYNHHASQRPLYSNERLPSLPLPQSQQAYSTGTSSPRIGSFGSASSLVNSGGSSNTSYTTASSSNEPKTPSPTLPVNGAIPAPLSHQSSYGVQQSVIPYTYHQDSYANMNQPSQDMYYSSHMSAGPGPSPQTVTAGGMGHYQHQQPPPLMQPGPGQYPPAQSAPYGQYGYSNGLTSPQHSGHQVAGSIGPQMSLPPMSAGQQSVMPSQGYPSQAQQGFDTTGQQAPHGMKPRVTATLWEDEGSLCFQVEAKGVCVARREDNHMINGTKLLNVAGMTRGRRDGILKSEKQRHVVKIGPMHLKGVWIPFERALDFANKEKITELLYPLFVHNIGALLYHPTNQNRTNVVMAAAERRKAEQSHMRNTQAPGLPSLSSHHHHSMQNGMGASSGHSLAPSASIGRPDGLQRAHTFPTPPTSASSVIGTMASGDSFQWSGQNMGNSQGGPLAIDTGIARSMPSTPATTPPGNSVQSMQQYQQNPQSYDQSRQMYSAPPVQQNAYPQPGNQDSMNRYGENGAYVKHEMGPPSGRALDNGAVETKSANGLVHHNQGTQPVHGHDDAEAEHDHDAEYTHDNHNGYNDANRGAYSYAPGPAAGDRSHISQDINGSPSQQNGTGRATPRTTAASQPYYQQGGYSTPPQALPPSSNLYNVMSSERGTANGSNGDVYAPQADLSSQMSNGYAPQPATNGVSNGKRGRDDDDDARPLSRGADLDGLKRRKTVRENSVPSAYNVPAQRNSAPVAAARRR